MRIALIGFGEVGQALAADLVADLAAFDLKFAIPDHPLPSFARATAAQAAADADLVISAVTAAQTVAAAKSVAAGLKPGAWFMDLNSSSPDTKTEAAGVIESGRGRYVEVAVMSPIRPKVLASPMLLGGPHAKIFEAEIRTLGFSGARAYSETLGKAAATKLCRSIMIKGLESLLTEALLSARYFGVEGEVLDSMSNLFPHPDWPAQAHYMISRAMEHGVRRAEEMREAAKTVAEAGLDPVMSDAIARRQDWVAAFKPCASEPDLAALLDAMRGKMKEGR